MSGDPRPSVGPPQASLLVTHPDIDDPSGDLIDMQPIRQEGEKRWAE